MDLAVRNIIGTICITIATYGITKAYFCSKPDLIANRSPPFALSIFILFLLTMWFAVVIGPKTSTAIAVALHLADFQIAEIHIFRLQIHIRNKAGVQYLMNM